MNSCSKNSDFGVLLSGGLDSSILVAHLMNQGETVQPFYIRCGLFWEQQELVAVREFLAAFPASKQRDLVILELPLGDLYRDHWSITGREIPGADTPDEAVFLPGRNALLIIKAAIWCQLHGISKLALAPLASNPFGDASDEFFASFQDALRHTGTAIEVLRPFGRMSKEEVMRLGASFPLSLTFSCISPEDGLHCGRCNKCAERQLAFRDAGIRDETRYRHDSN